MARAFAGIIAVILTGVFAVCVWYAARIYKEHKDLVGLGVLLGFAVFLLFPIWIALFYAYSLYP